MDESGDKKASHTADKLVFPQGTDKAFEVFSPIKISSVEGEIPQLPIWFCRVYSNYWRFTSTSVSNRKRSFSDWNLRGPTTP